MSEGSFFAELKRRNVFRVAAAYGVGAWLAIQVSDLVLPRLGLPDWTVTLVIVLALIGFPLALVLAWAYELTPESRPNSEGSKGRPIDRLIVVGLTLVIAVLLVERVWFANRDDDTPTQVAAPDHSLVVLPFANLSKDPDNEYFTDGLSEELMNVLTQAPSLRVIGRTSAFAWKGRNEDLRTIGAKLGVAHILEGSVRRQNHQVRITAQLVRAADGFHLWSQNYDRTLDDVFVIQDDIAKNVLRALEIVLDEAQRRRMESAGVRDVEAFVAYQKGYELFERAHAGSPILATLPRANAYFAEAVDRVPNFGTAHFLSADLYIHRLAATEGFFSREQQTQTLAELRATLATAYEASDDPLQRAVVDVDQVLFSDDWRPLRATIERAIGEPGCDARTLLLESAAFMGFAESMMAFYRREVECNPLNPLPWWNLAGASLWTGDQQQTLAILDAAHEAVGDHDMFASVRVQALIATGMLEEARSVAEGVDPKQMVYGPVVLSWVLAALRRNEEAIDTMHQRLGDEPADQAFIRGHVDAAVGDRDHANALATELDARPGGPAVITMWINGCACGLPFDMKAVPNLQKRVTEARIPWPPPTIVRYPSKDW